MADTARPVDASDHHPVVAATPARQGRLGRPVFWVLVISTLLAAVALVVAWGWQAQKTHSAVDAPPAGTNRAAPTAPAAPTPQTP